MPPIIDIKILVLFIGFLLIGTIFYLKLQEKIFFSSSVFVICISYLQGILISLCFDQTNYYILFVYTIIFGCLYYLLIPKLFLMIMLKIKSRNNGSSKVYNNENLINSLEEKTGISREKIKIYSFGEDIQNAFRLLSFVGDLVIYLGNGFIKKLNFDELLFVTCHEAGHTKTDLKMIIYFFVIGVALLFLSIIISVILPIIGILNLYTFFLVSIVIYLLGIACFNYLFWYVEFQADKFAIDATKDIPNAEAFFAKVSSSQTDYPMIVDLLFYDHPPIKERVKRIRGN
jgi:Zn-dependent protease with chaperone function